MKTKIFLFITKNLLFILFSAFVVIGLYSCRGIRRACVALISLFEFYCSRWGLYSFLKVEAVRGEQNAPLFTQEEIKTMAVKLPDSISRIQDIAEHYDISVRQAQKVRKYADNLALIHQNNAA